MKTKQPPKNKNGKATITYNGFGVGDHPWSTGNFSGKLEQVTVTAVNIELTDNAELKAMWYNVKCPDGGETSCDSSELHATIEEAIADMNKYLCTKIRDARSALGELLVNRAKFKAQVLNLTGEEVQDVEIPDEEEP